jgi:hypothetical protein
VDCGVKVCPPHETARNHLRSRRAQLFYFVKFADGALAAEPPAPTALTIAK